MAEPERPARVRRTQEERSTATRLLLLDATIESLIEVGYSATTTTVIAARAGVSRGAQLHHFPTKARQVAAALDHLAQKIGEELAREAGTLATNPDRLSAAADALWVRYGNPFFEAWLELWVAARTDVDLMREIRPIEDRLRRAASRRIKELFGEDEEGEALDAALTLTVYLLQGLAFDRTLRIDGTPLQEETDRQVLDLWKQVFGIVVTKWRQRRLGAPSVNGADARAPHPSPGPSTDTVITNRSA